MYDTYTQAIQPPSSHALCYLQFCSPRNDLSVCGLEPAPAATMQQMKASSTLDLLEERPDVTVNCTCPAPSVHVPVGTRREWDGSRVTTYACRMVRRVALLVYRPKNKQNWFNIFLVLGWYQNVKLSKMAHFFLKWEMFIFKEKAINE